MEASPHRLRAKQFPLLRRHDSTSLDKDWIGPLPPGRSLLRGLRALRRLLSVLLLTAVAALLQAVLIALPGRAKVLLPMLYWRAMCAAIGLSVQQIGTPAGRSGGRPVVFVSNHSSWLDIPVLGGRLEACFVAKEEVARWPLVIAMVARLGRTVFVRRQRSSTARERDDMRDAAGRGRQPDPVPGRHHLGRLARAAVPLGVLLGGRMAVTADGRPPLVQPVSVVYDRLAGLPTGRASRPLFAWYGDMDIASHFWRLAQHRGLRATVLLHAPLDPAAFADRKALAQATWRRRRRRRRDAAAEPAGPAAVRPAPNAPPRPPWPAGQEPALA